MPLLAPVTTAMGLTGIVYSSTAACALGGAAGIDGGVAARLLLVARGEFAAEVGDGVRLDQVDGAAAPAAAGEFRADAAGKGAGRGYQKVNFRRRVLEQVAAGSVALGEKAAHLSRIVRL